MKTLIIDKLAKMLRHKESAEQIGSIAEAEAFATRIQELLDKHKLEMSDIQFVELETSEPIEHECVRPDDLGIKQESKRIEWQEDLASAIAHANDCRTLINNYGNWSYFVGRKSDREICVSLLKYFTRLIVEMSDRAASAAKDTEREKLKAQMSWYTGADLRWHMRDYRVSFCEGMSNAIQHRLRERRRLREKELEKQKQESTALIHLRNTAEAVDSFINDKFKESKSKPNIQETRTVYEAYREGRKAGEQIALTSGALNG